MVWVDYAILAIIGLSTVISLVRGFVKEAISLIVWITAFFVASHYYPYLAPFFSNIENLTTTATASTARHTSHNENPNPD